MEEKEKVILRHTELANEYVQLSKSDHALPQAEWDKINARMKEILEEIDELKAVESQWKEIKEKTTYITAKEVSQSLGVSESKAYKIIKELNTELHSQGYITLAGRCPRAYFNEKWYGGTING